MAVLFAHSEPKHKTEVRKLRRDYVPCSRYAFPMKLRLKELRLEKGMTLEVLAEKAGMSKSYLSEIQSGKKQINARRLEALARALECSPLDILDDKSIGADVMDHLRILRDLSPDDQQAVIRHAQGLAGKSAQ